MPPPPAATRRNASAVLLTRGSGAELEVLLVERAPQLRFFGGYLALPGGVRGPEDGPDGPGDDDSEALRRCGVRELFEETGIALTPSLRQLDAGSRESLRSSLLDAERGTLDAASTEQIGELTVGSTPQALCRICTPPFAPVRYDTLFFTAPLPDGEDVDIRHGELVGGRFFRPGEALEQWRRGAVRIVPPVLILLELLRGGDLDGFYRSADALARRYAAGELHRVQFSPGIILAPLRTPTLPPATTTNCLIVGEERLWIVDPATPHAEEQERLFALLDALRADGRVLEGILLTHHHADHVGAVHATSARYDLPVRAHQLTLERLEPGFRAGSPLRDGDRIALGTAPDGTPEWQLEAVFTPGHDRGHLCFRELRYDTLIAGDMLSTVSTIVIDPPEGHLTTYLASLERLLTVPIATLYPAHGPALPNGHSLVDRYLQHRSDREDALLAALADSPSTAEALVPIVYADTDARLYPLAARSLLAGLQKLEENGRAARVGDRWHPA